MIFRDLEDFLKPAHMQVYNMKWEVEVHYVTRNQRIAEWTPEELLSRNKEYKAGEIVSDEAMQALKEAKARDVDALESRMSVDTTKGPTFTIKEKDV